MTHNSSGQEASETSLTATNLAASLLSQDNGAKGEERAKGEGFSLQFTTTQDVDAIADREKQRSHAGHRAVGCLGSASVSASRPGRLPPGHFVAARERPIGYLSSMNITLRSSLRVPSMRRARAKSVRRQAV
jgi:hypothetical protein